jgi:hypothetical protein
LTAFTPKSVHSISARSRLPSTRSDSTLAAAPSSGLCDTSMKTSSPIVRASKLRTICASSAGVISNFP